MDKEQALTQEKPKSPAEKSQEAKLSILGRAHADIYPEAMLKGVKETPGPADWARKLNETLDGFNQKIRTLAKQKETMARAGGYEKMEVAGQVEIRKALDQAIRARGWSHIEPDGMENAQNNLERRQAWGEALFQEEIDYAGAMQRAVSGDVPDGMNFRVALLRKLEDVAASAKDLLEEDRGVIIKELEADVAKIREITVEAQKVIQEKMLRPEEKAQKLEEYQKGIIVYDNLYSQLGSLIEDIQRSLPGGR